MAADALRRGRERKHPKVMRARLAKGAMVFSTCVGLMISASILFYTLVYFGLNFAHTIGRMQNVAAVSVPQWTQSFIIDFIDYTLHTIELLLLTPLPFLVLYWVSRYILVLLDSDGDAIYGRLAVGAATDAAVGSKAATADKEAAVEAQLDVAKAWMIGILITLTATGLLTKIISGETNIEVYAGGGIVIVGLAVYYRFLRPGGHAH